MAIEIPDKTVMADMQQKPHTLYTVKFSIEKIHYHTTQLNLKSVESPLSQIHQTWFNSTCLIILIKSQYYFCKWTFTKIYLENSMFFIWGFLIPLSSCKLYTPQGVQIIKDSDKQNFISIN